MALPDAWRQIEKPGDESITLFVSGDSSNWEYAGQLQNGTPLAPTNCAGLTLQAEIRTEADIAIATITAAFTTAATGAFKLSLTNDEVNAIVLPDDTPLKTGRVLIGRWQMAVVDGTDRFVVLAGNVWGKR